jgi:hypothetical protein
MQKMLPGKEHEGLKKSVGQYDVEDKMWMAPDAPPTVTKCTAEIKEILGGTHFQQDYKGEMMGKPYTGLGISGFDRVQNKYTSFWIGSFGTDMSTMTGTSTDGGKTINYTGACICPMTGGPVKLRGILTRINDDEFKFEMYMTQDEKEFKGMELNYTRKK